MKWKIITTAILKVLDIVHDILCPYFRDDKQNTRRKNRRKTK